MFEKLASRSIASLIAIGMALAVLPLLASAIVLHVTVNGDALAAFEDVALRYREQVRPIDDLQVALWEAAAPLEAWVDTRAPAELGLFREARVAIERRFGALRGRFAAEPSLESLLARAAEDWRRADVAATELTSTTRAPGDPTDAANVERVLSTLRAVTDKLKGIEAGIGEDLAKDHDRATLDYERGKWLSAVAALVSILGIVLSVLIISRVVLSNVRRLVSGARKFSVGDRDHRIDVRVPPELRDVAEELNRMISRINDAESALADQARRDTLTGLENRRAYDEALASAFARLRRMGEPVALLILDVDHFKRINDTHGHAAGDAVLVDVARRLQTRMREVDKAFRIGGEELAVIFAGTDRLGAVTAAERLRLCIADTPFAIPGGPAITVTVSGGLAVATGDGSAEVLVAAADRALYEAKSRGRNRIEVGEVARP